MSQIYHVFNKSIEHFQIFHEEYDYQRFLHSLFFYQSLHHDEKFSHYLRKQKETEKFSGAGLLKENTDNRIHFLSYCLMPTHFHLIVRIEEQFQLTRFLSDVLNSYSKYFNTKHKRKGPLWVGRTKRVDVDGEEGLERVTEYVYYNPVKAGLVSKPENWPWNRRTTS